MVYFTMLTFEVVKSRLGQPASIRKTELFCLRDAATGFPCFSPCSYSVEECNLHVKCSFVDRLIRLKKFAVPLRYYRFFFLFFFSLKSTGQVERTWPSTSLICSTTFVSRNPVVGFVARFS